MERCSRMTVFAAARAVCPTAVLLAVLLVLGLPTSALSQCSYTALVAGGTRARSGGRCSTGRRASDGSRPVRLTRTAYRAGAIPFLTDQVMREDTSSR